MGPVSYKYHKTLVVINITNRNAQVAASRFSRSRWNVLAIAVFFFWRWALQTVERDDRVSDTHASQHGDIYHNGSSGFGGNADSPETADLKAVYSLARRSQQVMRLRCLYATATYFCATLTFVKKSVLPKCSKCEVVHTSPAIRP
jgi:hypothetical protein